MRPIQESAMELLIFAAIIGLWLILQIWVLPKLGVPT
jgi:hypothetical protein